MIETAPRLNPLHRQPGPEAALPQCGPPEQQHAPVLMPDQGVFCTVTKREVQPGDDGRSSRTVANPGRLAVRHVGPAGLCWHTGIAVPDLEEGMKQSGAVFGLRWRPHRVRKLSLADADGRRHDLEGTEKAMASPTDCTETDVDAPPQYPELETMATPGT